MANEEQKNNSTIIEDYFDDNPDITLAGQREIAAKAYANALRNPEISALELKLKYEPLQKIATSAGLIENSTAVGRAIAQPFGDSVEALKDGVKALQDGSAEASVVAAAIKLSADPLANVKSAWDAAQAAPEAAYQLAKNVPEAAYQLAQHTTGMLTMEERQRLAALYDLPHEQRIQALHGVALDDTATMVSIGSLPGILPNAMTKAKVIANDAGAAIARETDLLQGPHGSHQVTVSAGTGVAAETNLQSLSPALSIATQAADISGGSAEKKAEIQPHTNLPANEPVKQNSEVPVVSGWQTNRWQADYDRKIAQEAKNLNAARGGYLEIREALLSDGRYKWRPVAVDEEKTIVDAQQVRFEAKLEQKFGGSRLEGSIHAKPPVPDYLQGTMPKTMAEKEALLAIGQKDIMARLADIRASKLIPNSSDESAVFLHNKGAPPAFISAEYPEHHLWRKVMKQHEQDVTAALIDKAIYGVEKPFQSKSILDISQIEDRVRAEHQGKSRPPGKMMPEIQDDETYRLAAKFFRNFSDQAYLVQLGKPGDKVDRLMTTPNLLNEKEAVSILAVTSTDANVKFVQAKGEMYNGKVPDVSDYKNITSEEAYKLTYQEENPAFNARAAEFLSNVANSAYLKAHGNEGDTIKRIQLLNFVEKGTSESLLIVNSTDGSQKLVHATDELNGYRTKYATIDQQQAEAILDRYKAMAEARIAAEKQPDAGDALDNKGPER